MVCLALPVLVLESSYISVREWGNMHRANTAVLPADPSFGTGVVVALDIKRELLVRVILPSQVRQDCVALKDSEAIVVVVYNGRNASIGVDGSEPGLLLNILANVDALGRILQAVRILELLEKDRGFISVGCCCCISLAVRSDEIA